MMKKAVKKMLLRDNMDRCQQSDYVRCENTTEHELYYVTEEEVRFMMEKISEYVKNSPKRAKRSPNPEALHNSTLLLIHDTDLYNRTIFDAIKKRRSSERKVGESEALALWLGRKVIAYCRNSSEVDQKFPRNIQEENILAFAEKNNIKIIPTNMWQEEFNQNTSMSAKLQSLIKDMADQNSFSLHIVHDVGHWEQYQDRDLDHETSNDTPEKKRRNKK